MRFGDLVTKARKTVDQRGGTDALKRDAQELKNIARGPGSTQQKAKRAAEALRKPGGSGDRRPGERPEGPPR